MEYRHIYTTGTVATDERAFFEERNKGYKCTGETLTERIEEVSGLESMETTYVVMTGKFTAYGMCRDCGDHYIIAKWDRYDRIDKGTMKRTADVEDR